MTSKPYLSLSKSVCQTCGTLNSVDGEDAYSFNKNVYILYPCDNNFFFDFDNTEYEPYNETYHTTVLKKGQYCQFCKGTQARASESQQRHNFTETIDAQLGNSRFYVSETCGDCGYETSEYLTAKSVVSSYYGTEDGNAHTVTVSDLSDSGVHTSIRYGTSAGKCNLTSAPNYTEAGYYPVYYEIDYQYDNKNMTENGVSYVWLLEEEGDTVIILSPMGSEENHTHDYRYVETVLPSCTDLGFEYWQCDGCGRLEKRNYTLAAGHSYEDITIREATCKQGGLVLTMCKKCGDFHETTTPTGAHTYTTKIHNPTCREVGYTEHICSVCGDNFITDITGLISHAYERITKAPICTEQGYTTSTCTMCGASYVSDYIEPTGHSWDEGHTVTSPTCTGEGVTEFHCKNCTEKMIKAESATGHTPGAAATCTEPQTCEKCGTVLELPKGHSYETKVTAPTCTAMGYTVYACTDCGDSYTADYMDKAEHDYNTVVTAPTCTEHGFTTYTCSACGDSYISDYAEKLQHEYETSVTPPTCTSMGFTTYTCKVCGDSYIGDYTDMMEHNYSRQVIPPTCTEHGYTVYTCPDCGKEYIGDLTDCEQHRYTETVTPPTCTEMGYTTYVCETCGDTYKADYTDKIPHDYNTAVTAPTCTGHGFTVYTCKNCGYSYTGDYTEALGHKPSEWIIDVPATIENAGQKHMECLTCGAVLKTVEIPQLIDTDHSDEDGDAAVGDYSIILTDENGKPVFDSEITIDKDDNVTIKLPEGRLLDYADRTTITVFYTETQEPKEGLQIFIYDGNNNAATGATDENGQLTVPNSQSSTGDDNGTVGTEDGEQKMTYVVTVTDKANIIIPNCDIYIGESNNLVVDLADGVKPTRENPVIITVTDQNGNAQTGVTVIALGDADYIEKGVTDLYGQVTVPPVNAGYTNSDGRVTVQGYNVTVTNETGNIAGALVMLTTTQNAPDENDAVTESENISVQLPENIKVDDYDNRVTVTVLNKADNAPVSGMPITITEAAAQTEQPEENPALTEKPEQPEDTPEPPKSASGITDKNGKVTVPPLNEDVTGDGGDGDITETKPGEDADGDGAPDTEDTETAYTVTVSNKDGNIANALVKIEDGKITVTLPDTYTLTTSNQTTVTVKDKDGNPVKGVSVTVKDKATEKSGTTNASGQVILPVKSTGGSSGGSSGGSGGGGGWSSSINSVNVTVTDKDNKTVSVSKSTGTDKVTLTLPAGKTLVDGNWYTVTVTDRNGKAKADYTVVLKDRNKNEATGETDKNGIVILPAAEHKAYIVGYDDGTFRPDGDMTRAEAAAIFARLISEEKGETASGKATFTDIADSAWYAAEVGYLEKYGIIEGYEDGTFRPDAPVTRAEFTAMTVRYYGLFHEVKYPANTTKYADISHSYWAVKDISFATNEKWLNGYADGSFWGDSNITRAEVVTVVNRMTGRTADKEYINDNLSVLDKFTDLKNNAHWAYYDIMEATNTHKSVSDSENEIWVK